MKKHYIDKINAVVNANYITVLLNSNLLKLLSNREYHSLKIDIVTLLLIF